MQPHPMGQSKKRNYNYNKTNKKGRGQRLHTLSLVESKRRNAALKRDGMTHKETKKEI